MPPLQESLQLQTKLKTKLSIRSQWVQFSPFSVSYIFFFVLVSYPLPSSCRTTPLSVSRMSLITKTILLIARLNRRTDLIGFLSLFITFCVKISLTCSPLPVTRNSYWRFYRGITTQLYLRSNTTSLPLVHLHLKDLIPVFRFQGSSGSTDTK